MSDNFIRLIPTVPLWQPTDDAALRGRTFVAELFPAAHEVTLQLFERVEFIDSGVNTDHADCPRCGAPCCGAIVSLNELNYDWAVGFARFEISVMNGSREQYELVEGELDQLATILGHPVRQVLAHY